MTPKEILRAYSQQQATMEQVVRAFLTHDDWLVETTHAVNLTGQTRFPQGYILGQPGCDIPADQLWFYTDKEATDVAVAKGARLGMYVGGISGTQLFAALPADRVSVQINPGCAKEETWYLGQDAFALIGLWARALAVEAQLGAPDSPEKFAALRDHPGYLYFMHPEQQAIATAAGMSGMKNPAMIFTALDCAQMVSRSYSQLEQKTAGGAALFAWLRNQGVDGVIFNPLGPGTKAAYDISICDQILATHS